MNIYKAYVNRSTQSLHGNLKSGQNSPDFTAAHSTYIYKEYHSLCPLVGIGTPPTPSLASESAPPPPPTKGGGRTPPRPRGWGESQFRRLEYKLSTLPTLCTAGLGRSERCGESELFKQTVTNP